MFAATGDHTGKTHILPLRQSSVESLFISTTSPTDVQVTVSFPTETQHQTSLTVKINAGATVPITPWATDGLIYIKGSAAISVIDMRVGSCSAFLSIPMSSAGLSYVVTTWDELARVQVTSSEATNQITGKFGGPSSQAVVWKGNLDASVTTTFGGATFNIDLNTHGQYIEMSSKDLTGTTITGLKPITVVAENTKVLIKQTGKTYESPLYIDSVAEMLMPSNTWGKKFIVPGIPDLTNTGYFIKIVTLGTNTFVTIVPNISPVSRNVGANMMEIIEVPGNQPLVITSNDQIQVIQYIQSKSVFDTEQGFPTAINIPPVEQRIHQYSGYLKDPRTVSTSKRYIVIAIETTYKDGLYHNGNAIGQQAGWKVIAGSNPETVITTVDVTSNMNQYVNHIGSRPFTCFAYVIDNNSGGCAYGTTLGMGMKPYDQVTQLKKLVKKTKKRKEKYGIKNKNIEASYMVVGDVFFLQITGTPTPSPSPSPSPSSISAPTIDSASGECYLYFNQYHYHQITAQIDNDAKYTLHRGEATSIWDTALVLLVGPST